MLLRELLASISLQDSRHTGPSEVADVPQRAAKTRQGIEEKLGPPGGKGFSIGTWRRNTIKERLKIWYCVGRWGEEGEDEITVKQYLTNSKETFEGWDVSKSKILISENEI